MEAVYKSKIKATDAGGRPRDGSGPAEVPPGRFVSFSVSTENSVCRTLNPCGVTLCLGQCDGSALKHKLAAWRDEVIKAFGQTKQKMYKCYERKGYGIKPKPSKKDL